MCADDLSPLGQLGPDVGVNAGHGIGDLDCVQSRQQMLDERASSSTARSCRAVHAVQEVATRVVEIAPCRSGRRVVLLRQASGGATVKVVVLLTPEEIDAAAKRSVDYRAPGT